jgi:hypothetical protein
MKKHTAEQLAALGLSAEQIEAVLKLGGPVSIPIERPRRQRVRSIVGTRPKDASGLLIDGRAENSDSLMADWRLYLRPSLNPDWLNLKLIRITSASRGPGNFWLGWNIPQKRFGQSDYLAALPDSVRTALEQFFNDDLPRGELGAKFSDFDLEFYAKLLAETDATDLLS